jgi:hypothetical protein
MLSTRLSFTEHALVPKRAPTSNDAEQDQRQNQPRDLAMPQTFTRPQIPSPHHSRPRPIDIGASAKMVTPFRSGMEEAPG